ncbi:MAG: RDD family protein [Ruminococcus sp.]|nr:RDD family protein [Ruminococcus sp.]
MLRRIIAAVIDFFLSVIPLFIISNIIINNVTNKSVNPQATPYIAFQLILSPIENIQKVIENPYTFSLNIEELLISVLLVFLSEVILYSLFDLSPMKKTIGKAMMNLKYEHKLTVWDAMLRNAIKVLTRYLFGIPLIFVLFSKKRYLLQDILTDNTVIASEQ